MRFIHTADWHLGRLFHGHHLTDDQAYLLLGDFLHFVTDSKAQAVVIAGDIYDRAVPPTEAVELFDEVLARLVLDCGVQVLFVAGNHDSAQRVGFAGRLLADRGVFVRGSVSEGGLEPVILSDEYGSVAFELYPYMEPATVRAVFPEVQTMDFDTAIGYVVKAGLSCMPAGVRKVAVAHAFLAGGRGTDSERPLSVGGSSYISPAYFSSFAYTAMGHLHNMQSAGADNIRYSGSLLKYSFAEAGQKKGMMLVDIDAVGQVKMEEVSFVPHHEVQRVRGFLSEIVSDRHSYPLSEAYTLVELLDKEAVLDAYGKLEKVYPNLMQIERPNLLHGGELGQGKRQKKSETEVFQDFFQEMTGEHMTEGQLKVLADNIEKVWQEERESVK